MGITSVAVQFTIIDLLSRGVDKIKGRMESLARANKDVQHSFDRMTTSAKYAAYAGVATVAMARGLKPAVAASASLEEATLRVKGNLAGSAKDAADLNRQLRVVTKTAIGASANAPISAVGVIDIENALLKAGVALEDVTGKAGAAFAATVLTSLTGEAPAMIGEALANIGAQFDLKGGEYGDLADWLVRVDDASATTVPALIYGFTMVGASAKTLDISAKDVVTTMGALAPLGPRAASSFNMMLSGMAKQDSFFEGGKFIGMERATEHLRATFGAIKDDQELKKQLTKYFGEEGERAAATLIDAKKGFSEIESEAKEALSAAEKLDIWAEGFNASMAKLRGTSSTTLAVLFQPILHPLTAIVNKTNEWVAALGKVAQENQSISKTVSSLSLGAVATGGLATLGLGAGALFYGRKVLKGVGGIKGLLGSAASATAGIATGKAVEAATGVQPVFITNWPGGYMPGGGTGGMMAEVAAGAAGGGILKKMLGKAGSLSKLAMPMLGKAGLVGAVGAGSYALGMGVNKLLAKGSGLISGGKYADDGWLGDMIYDLFHREQDREVKNDIELNVSIDERGRVISESNDRNTRANVQPLNRGEFGSWQTAMAH